MTTANESQVELACNTKKASSSKARKPQPVQCYRWQFTLKAIDNKGEPIEPETIYSNLINYCKEFYYQLEQGEGENGYLHYQGCLSLKTKERFDTVCNIIGYNIAHVESAKNWQALINYCMKTKTRQNGPWSHKSSFIKTIQQLNWWQEAIFEDIQNNEPDPRKIYWVWDKDGNIGKTVFCKYCAVKLGVTVIGNGKFTDMAYRIQPNVKTVFFSFPRTIEGKVNYSAIEAIKDGMIDSHKYESNLKLFNIPHVYVFCNFAPDTSKLSQDRWEIIDLSI